VTRKYPLDPLKRVRAERVDAQTRSLSEARRLADAADGEVERRVHAKEQLDQSVSATAQSERARLEHGELTAADLARGAAWSIAAGMKQKEMARALDVAQAEQKRTRSVVEHERASLATAEAEAKVVDKHHAKWRAAKALADVARDEENAAEAHQARRGGRPRP
jgi:hypothetical protein